jgi:uncharacterized protein DUF3761
MRLAERPRDTEAMMSSRDSALVHILGSECIRREAPMRLRVLLTLCVASGLATVAAGYAYAVPRQQPQQPTSQAPAGATARCRDGTYSFSRHRSGTCSYHGGVATWLGAARTLPPTASDTSGQVPERDSPTCGGHCGVERWAVKTLSDPDRKRVQFRPVDTTIEALVALQRPGVLSPLARAVPVEMTVYRVGGRLLWLFTEADHDYHLVLASLRDSTMTMIAEIPDPGCAGACVSGFAAVYRHVRQKLLDYLNAPHSEARPLVRITGVGFFDYLHGQRGVAPNGIELHPVLDVEFP